MNHPLTPETSQVPLAPGLRLPRSERTQLSPEAVAEIRAIAAQYPDKLAGTLPAIYIAQREFGFVSLAAMKEVARALEVPEGHVFGVATFYTMFRKQPAGRYHLQVCTNLCCALNGARELLDRVAKKTGAVPGEGPTADGLWSLEEVECLASCGSAPCLQVNHEVYDEFVDEAKLEAILEACRQGEYRPWGE
ncbi:MAG: NAD(P)H-dependent oxidoreductase subunit E [Holophaga sp.]|jgi:NADH-quinone oxidoreductase E subunit